LTAGNATFPTEVVTFPTVVIASPVGNVTFPTVGVSFPDGNATFSSVTVIFPVVGAAFPVVGEVTLEGFWMTDRVPLKLFFGTMALRTVKGVFSDS